MRKSLYAVAGLMIILASCKTSYFTAKDKKTVNRVADWQIKNYSDTLAPVTGWVHAALYRGMVEWANSTQSEKIYKFLYQIGEQQNWGMMPERVYDADDVCVGQTYFRLYDKYGKEEMITKVKDRIDYIIANPDTNPLITKEGKYYRNRWGWCDALFMAPPVYARLSLKTGDNKYLDFCFSEYKVTTDSLYDRDRKLFYRDLRLVNNRDAKGEKIFWGRGNGWVYAGLALMLDIVPASHPSYNYYKTLYLEMTDAIVKSQDANGAWHSSLFDVATYPQPENSASGFFVYGLSWGLNNNLITDATYRQAAIKGWRSLQQYVHPDGKLGYVQPIGHAPRDITFDMTAPYGIGAYLLAATEMRKMAAKKTK
ncbi:MAG TPA: glycoside hydrolase family 88 protein [Chitinophagaceae bacterium]